MAIGWVYVINQGFGTPRIARTSHAATTVVQEQPGVYVVTFPFSTDGMACIATLGNSVGTITATPGESSGLSPNQVRVMTLTLQNQFNGAYDFSLAVFCSASRFWWPGLLVAGAALVVWRMRQQTGQTAPEIDED